MQRISQVCSRTFRINKSPVYFVLNVCTRKTCSELKRFYQRPRLCADINHRVKFDPSSSCRPKKVLLAFGLSALTKFLGLTEEKEDSELIQIIKKAEVAMIVSNVLGNAHPISNFPFVKRDYFSLQKKEYNKSEQLFHLALKIAQELKNENGVTYIFDRLANLAFETGKNEKARKLFVSVMQRLLDQGMDKDNLILIHISFKLAKIFENVRDFQ